MSDETKAIEPRKPELKSIMRSDQIVSRFEEVVGRGQAGGYIASVLLAVSQNEKLAECTSNSIIGSALRAATLRLSCDPSIGHAYLVPYKNKATMIVGWRGLKHMALRTQKYRHLNLIKVYEDDEIYIDRSTGIITMMAGKTEIIPYHREHFDVLPAGYMLYMEMLYGYKHTFFMTVEECDRHGARYSPNYGYKNSMWQTDPHVMYRKTVVRQGITKEGYLDPHDLLTLSSVDETEDDDTNYLEGIEIKEEKKDKNQLLTDMGFESEEHQPEIVEPEQPTTSMDLDTAKAIKNQEGKSYGDIDSKTLSHMILSLTKSIENNGLSLDEMNEKKMKRDAIGIILNHRSKEQK